MRRRRGHDRFDLAHHRVVDVKPAGRVDDHRVLLQRRGRRDLFGHVGGDARRVHGGNRDLQLLSEGAQLFDRRRTVDVRGDERRPAALLAQRVCELRRRRRLAGPLEPDQHDDRRRVRGRREAMGAAEELDQLVLDNLDDLLARRERLEHVLAERPRLDAVDERPYDLEVDVSLEERHPYLAERLLNVVLREPSVAAHPVEDALETSRERIKHAKPLV